MSNSGCVNGRATGLDLFVFTAEHLNTINPYMKSGHFSGCSNLPPDSTNTRTSLFSKDGYGVFPSENISHKVTPYDH